MEQEEQKRAYLEAEKQNALTQVAKVDQERINELRREEVETNAKQKAAEQEAEQVPHAFEACIHAERLAMEQDLERKRLAAIEEAETENKRVKRQEALLAARDIRLMTGPILSDDVTNSVSDQAGITTSPSKSVGSLLDGALGLLSGDPDSMAFPESLSQRSKKVSPTLPPSVSPPKTTSPTPSNPPYVDPNSPDSAYSSPYGNAHVSDGSGSVFSPLERKKTRKKKARKKKARKKKSKAYDGSPTSSERSSPTQMNLHENISGILPIDAYMAATEEKIQMEKRRLKDYKRAQRRIHSELVEQHMRHRAYVKKSKSVSPKQRRKDRARRRRGRRSPIDYMIRTLSRGV